MKSGFNFYVFLSLSFFSLFFTGCKIVKPPSLTTLAVSDIEPHTAKAGGNITSDGNTDILVRGVCWSISKSPTTEDTRTTDGYGVGTYTSNLTNLIPNTVYYVRAYATNKEGTAYGNQVTFTTGELSIAELTTAAISGITQTSAVSGGNITFDGGSEIAERGVCWSTHAVPTLADSKTSNGTGAGIFSSNITGLTGNTRYYVRAYATNAIGTAYGQEISFVSGSVLAVLTTEIPSATGTTTGSGGGNITNDGGSAVTVRGVCWSTSANPTISGNKTINGAGTGSFTSEIAGLAPNTRYHVRAYATNSVGTAYGTDRTFTTDPVSIQDYDDNNYNVIRVGTQVWIKENLKTTHFNDGTAVPLVTGNAAWISLTTPGYCWYGNNESNKDVYGALYNWHAVDAGNLCPGGWHVPTDAEWLVLINYLGGASPAGGRLKETGTSHWQAPNTGATNESGFTARPGGRRLDTTGTFELIGNSGFWWAADKYDTSNAWYRRINSDEDRVFRVNQGGLKTGMSVRCIKD